MVDIVLFGLPYSVIDSGYSPCFLEDVVTTFCVEQGVVPKVADIKDIPLESHFEREARGAELSKPCSLQYIHDA